MKIEVMQGLLDADHQGLLGDPNQIALIVGEIVNTLKALDLNDINRVITALNYLDYYKLICCE